MTVPPKVFVEWDGILEDWLTPLGFATSLVAANCKPPESVCSRGEIVTLKLTCQVIVSSCDDAAVALERHRLKQDEQDGRHTVVSMPLLTEFNTDTILDSHAFKWLRRKKLHHVFLIFATLIPLVCKFNPDPFSESRTYETRDVAGSGRNLTVTIAPVLSRCVYCLSLCLAFWGLSHLYVAAIAKKAILSFDAFMLIFNSVGESAALLFNHVALVQSAGKLEAHDIIVEVSRQLIGSVCVTTALAMMDAFKAAKRLKLALITSAIISTMYSYFSLQLQDNLWIESEFCYWTRCASPQEMYTSCLGTRLCFMLKLAWAAFVGNDFVVLRPQYKTIASVCATRQTPKVSDGVCCRMLRLFGGKSANDDQHDSNAAAVVATNSPTLPFGSESPARRIETTERQTDSNFIVAGAVAAQKESGEITLTQAQIVAI